ncbi:unnamed protein product [Malus baccata var. baccata]
MIGFCVWVGFSIFWTVKEGEFKHKIRSPKCRMGRVKLKIKGLENTNGRQATYAKRKNGIMKKANELSILCDIDIVLLMFSPTRKPSLCNGEGRKEGRKERGRKEGRKKREKKQRGRKEGRNKKTPRMPQT